ncbi:MAG: hypothetical protein AAF616_08515 [Bacteroidota bacterium]
MKKAIRVARLLPAFAMIFSTTYASATTSSIKVQVVGEKKFYVEISDIQGSSISLIRDQSGQVLYSKASNEDFLTISFDFGRLPVGSYEFVLRDQSKEQILPIEVLQDELFVNKEKIRKIFFPQVKQTGDEVTVRLISDGENDLSVTIASKKGDLLFEDRVDARVGLIGKRFLFEDGEYVVSIASDEYFSTQELTIRK